MLQLAGLLDVLACETPLPPAPAGKLPFEDAPQDDRQLADIHLALYNDVVVFDHATKLAYVIAWVSGKGANWLRAAVLAVAAWALTAATQPPDCNVLPACLTALPDCIH